MSITSLTSAIANAIALVRKLDEIAKKLKQAEIKAMIAELADQLADAKMKMAELKNDIASLQEENKALKSKAEGEKPTMQWGCYIFEGDARLYCPACFDTKGMKYVTTRLNSRRRRCSVCQREF